MGVRALVMAGGRGQRLHPLTAHLPKPLMPIGDKPLLEIIIRRLCRFGIREVTLAVSYLAPLIQAYFADGSRFGAKITYLHEETPLGTAGSIARMPQLDDTLVVINGDILTDLNLEALLAEHRAQRAALTIASMMIQTDIKSGVLDTDLDGRVIRFREKPQLRHRICIGAYALEPAVRRHSVPGARLEMPELIARLIDAGEHVVAYDHTGSWIDIGRPDEYARAQIEADRILGEACSSPPSLETTGASHRQPPWAAPTHW